MVVHMHNDLANCKFGIDKLTKLLERAFGEDQAVQGAGRDGRLQYVPLQGHTRTPQSGSSD